MYGREYEGRELRFEASGGLLYDSLVMRDKETDSWWSLMIGEAIAGDFKGTRLRELPGWTKTRWKDWVADHPDTLVLSVGGSEHDERNHYEEYFASEQGFRGSTAADHRLPTKSPVFAFQMDGRAFAVPFSAYGGGASFAVGEEWIFLFRTADASIFEATAAFRSASPGFRKENGFWIHVDSGARFDPATSDFGKTIVPRLNGFDTFWFNWSMTHPDTELVTGTR